MKDINKVSPGYYHSGECNLADFKKIVDQKLDIGSVPNAAEIQKIFLSIVLKTYKTLFKMMN